MIRTRVGFHLYPKGALKGAGDDWLVGFLMTALIGNSIGGVVFAAVLNHAQAKEEI